MYLQLDVVRALTASAIVSILDANRWYHVSIISEDTYADDGFVDAFYALTTAASSRKRRDSSGNWTASDWSVEDYIRVSRRSTRDEVDRQLLVLLENHSRVIVLHSRLASYLLITHRHTGLQWTTNQLGERPTSDTFRRQDFNAFNALIYERQRARGH